MRRSTNRRSAPGPRLDRRLLIAASALVVFGGIIGVTQISRADTNGGASVKAIKINGLDVLANTCDDSRLPQHDGFQKGDRCVTTQFGEVASAGSNASLLITQAPRRVDVNQPFTLLVSTRNLLRDRFLAAGQGGYYVESSLLQGGIVRGHFHTACRMLQNQNAAPNPEPVPAFFVATEDKKGGRAPDTVTINVPGLPQGGTAQCASWAGDGSHRIPMMERANQTPAFDSVRIQVGGGGGGNNGGGQNNGGQNNGGQNNGGQNNGGQNNGGQNNGGNNNGGQNNNGGGQNNGGQQPAQGNGGSQPNPRPSQSTGVAPVKTGADPVAKPPAKPAAVGANNSTKSGTSTTGTKSPAKSTSTKNNSTSNGSVKASGGSSSTANSTKADSEYTLDQGAQPDPGNGQSAKLVAAKGKDSGILALTGANTAAIAGFGSVMLAIGFVGFALSRRRRGHTYYR
jgi:hypothetical protein